MGARYELELSTWRSTVGCSMQLRLLPHGSFVLGQVISEIRVSRDPDGSVKTCCKTSSQKFKNLTSAVFYWLNESPGKS